MSLTEELASIAGETYTDLTGDLAEFSEKCAPTIFEACILWARLSGAIVVGSHVTTPPRLRHAATCNYWLDATVGGGGELAAGARVWVPNSLLPRLQKLLVQAQESFTKVGGPVPATMIGNGSYRQKVEAHCATLESLDISVGDRWECWLPGCDTLPAPGGGRRQNDEFFPKLEVLRKRIAGVEDVVRGEARRAFAEVETTEERPSWRRR